jgi:hypothetical protein
MDVHIICGTHIAISLHEIVIIPLHFSVNLCHAALLLFHSHEMAMRSLALAHGGWRVTVSITFK